MNNEKIKLRYHHVDRLYSFIHDRHSFSQLYMKAGRYTEEEIENTNNTFKWILGHPAKTTMIEVTSFEDIICEKCTRKDDENRKLKRCYTPDKKLDPENNFSLNFTDVMDIQIGETYTLEEILEKIEEYHRIEGDVVSEATKDNLCISDLRKRLFEKGLLKN